jgi:hypothetical protein
MGRPTKQGVDYFPVDCVFDKKTKLYLMEKESVGLAVLISTWAEIYVGDGYFIDNDDDLYLSIKQRVGGDVVEIRGCIEACLKRNIFDNRLHDEHKILTSRAIQTRYFVAARKKARVKVNPEYLLINVSGVGNLIDSAGNPFVHPIPLSGIDSAGNAVTAAGNPDLSDLDKIDMRKKNVSAAGNGVTAAGNGVKVSGNATKEEEEEDSNNSNNNSAPENLDYRRSENQKRITRDFVPDEHDYLILKGQSIPQDFVESAIPEFIEYWIEKDFPHDGWRSVFRKRVITLWLEKACETNKPPQQKHSSGSNGKSNHANRIAQLTREYAESFETDAEQQDDIRVVP